MHPSRKKNQKKWTYLSQTRCAGYGHGLCNGFLGISNVETFRKEQEFSNMILLYIHTEEKSKLNRHIIIIKEPI